VGVPRLTSIVVSAYIKKLIREGENQHLDFKYCITDSRKIARSLVAFANTDGGTLLIGVKDNGAVTGISSDEEYFMVEAAAQMYSKPEVFFETHSWNVGGKTVLEIKIPKSEKRPHLAQTDDHKWLAYIRVDDQNLLANSVLLRVWEKQERKNGIHIKYTEKESKLFHYLEENSTITLSKFCRIAQISHHKAEQILVDLISLSVIEIVFTQKQIFYRLGLNYKPTPQ